MAIDRDPPAPDAASRGKYAPLYRRLAVMDGPAWHVSFAELESILGFDLPASARRYRSWWSNRKRSAGHSHALSWHAAGWKTRAVDLEAETLAFERANPAPDDARGCGFDLDKIWPAIPGGTWPPGFTVGREQIYDEAGRLTGGPQDKVGNDR